MDSIFASWIRAQHEQGLQLASKSDVLKLNPLDDQRFLANFLCAGLVREKEGDVEVAHAFAVGFFFPSTYLREANPAEVVTWLAPRKIFHPNVRPPFCCLGRITPGTSLVDLLYRTFELITWQSVCMREDDALDAKACRWARHNPSRIPVDPRPLKRANQSSSPLAVAGEVAP